MSKLADAKAIMRCTTSELSELLDMPAPTVTAYLQGKRTEYLNDVQLKKLRDALVAYQADVTLAVDLFVES